LFGNPKNKNREKLRGFLPGGCSNDGDRPGEEAAIFQNVK